jgi:hypothetical protein
MSALYDALLADRLTDRLGVWWERRGDPRKPKNQAWEIAGVPGELIAEFSQRAHGIEAVKNELIAAYREAHGREPDDATIVRLRQQATYATRPDKTFRSLVDMTTGWRARAARILPTAPGRWAGTVIARPRKRPTVPVSFDDMAAQVDELARRALDELSTERSTWRTWNIRASAARASMPHRLATAAERDTLIEMITRRVSELSVCITPPVLASTPEVFLRADGSSAFRRAHSEVYTSAEVLAAEDRLLASSSDRRGPTALPASAFPDVAVAAQQHQGLSVDQRAAVDQIATSGHVLDVLVGPAGSGKTTSLAVLRTMWEAEHGRGSVIGLAPSSTAADVLGHSLGIDA